MCTKTGNCKTYIKIYRGILDKQYAQIDKEKREWIDTIVYPRLVCLINKAQRRLKLQIRFLSGNGTYSFFLGDRRLGKRFDDLSWWLTEAASKPESPSENPIIPKIRRRFPELVEFCDIVAAVQDELDEIIDDVYPTVNPKE